MPHRYPDSAVLYRSLTKDFPLAVRGEGCWLYDETGRVYLDAVGGAYVASLGHGVREMLGDYGKHAESDANNVQPVTHEKAAG